MRLTLRTLLAYRDQVLGPDDVAVLEKRLRESQAARGISNKIAHLVANPVATPLAIDAREFGYNPNDVAGFLDDAMPSDRVADMELKCLDNLPLLAEVASCHQILARSIRTPASVSPGIRNRLIGLWKERYPHSEISRPAGRDEEKPSNTRTRREIPAYLQQPDRHWIGTALRLTMLLTLLVVCVAQSLGPWRKLRDLLDRQPNGSSSPLRVPPLPEPIER